MNGTLQSAWQRGFLLVVPLSLYLLIVSLSRLFPSTFDNTIDSWSVPDLVQSIALILHIPLTVYLAHRIGWLSAKDIGLIWSIGKKPFNYWVRVIVMVVFFFFTALIVVINIVHYQGLVLVLKSSTPGTLNMSYFIFPIQEEIIFRGVICTVVARMIGWRWALFLSGTLFGIAHLLTDIHNLPYFIYTSLIGYFLSWVYSVSRTLVMPTVCHTGINCLLALLLADSRIWYTFVELVTF